MQREKDSASHDMLRCKLTSARVAQFNLQRWMRDLEFVVKLMIKFFQKLVARMAFRHDKVTGQGRLGGAHCPCVQIMDRLDTWETGEILGDFLRIDFGWDSVE